MLNCSFNYNNIAKKTFKYTGSNLQTPSNITTKYYTRRTIRSLSQAGLRKDQA